MLGPASPCKMVHTRHNFRPLGKKDTGCRGTPSTAAHTHTGKDLIELQDQAYGCLWGRQLQLNAIIKIFIDGQDFRDDKVNGNRTEKRRQAGVKNMQSDTKKAKSATNSDG